MARIQQSSRIQSWKPYMLTMPNTSRQMHPNSVTEWRRRGPSLFDDDEAKLQYLTMIANRDDTLLSTLAGWDDGLGGIANETRQSRYREGPDRQARKKMSFAEYSKKTVSGGRSAEPEGARSTKENERLTNATGYNDDEPMASPTVGQEGNIEPKKPMEADKTPNRARNGAFSLSASVELKFSAGGNETQDKESSVKKRGQKRRIEAITEAEDASKTRQESRSPPATKRRASPTMTSTAQEATSSFRGSTARGDKSPSEASERHHPSETKGSDAVPVLIMKPLIKMGAAILPLPPTKDKIVRQRMRGVATIKSRALPEPSARTQVSTRPGGAQDPPLCVSQEQLEWIELEVARRVAAVLALSKDENAPAASAGASYKDAGTQIDAVISTAKASGVGNDCVCIAKEKIQTAKPREPVKGADKELPTTASSDQAGPKLEIKAAKSAEQAMQHVEEPRKGRPLQPKNQNPSVDPNPAAKKARNTAPATTESRASAAPKPINSIKNQASKPAPKKNRRPLVPNWFQMLQPPPK